MLSTVLFAWLHYFGFMLMAGGLVAELYLLKLEPRADVVRLLPRVDRFYLIGAVVVLFSGLVRMSAKGVSYYLHVGPFHGVLTLFVLGVLISLAPTFRFIGWRRVLDSTGALPEASAWAGTRKFIHPQMTALAAIALLMVLTARSYGSAVQP